MKPMNANTKATAIAAIPNQSVMLYQKILTPHKSKAYRLICDNPILVPSGPIGATSKVKTRSTRIKNNNPSTPATQIMVVFFMSIILSEYKLPASIFHSKKHG
jgi:hypothetical protein